MYCLCIYRVYARQAKLFNTNFITQLDKFLHFAKPLKCEIFINYVYGSWKNMFAYKDPCML